MKLKFLDTMLIILGVIGFSIVVLSALFVLYMGAENTSDITFKFNLLTFLTGISYIIFILVIVKLKKK